MSSASRHPYVPSSPLGDDEILTLDELPDDVARKGNADLSNWLDVIEKTRGTTETNLSPLLPYLLNLRGEPYSLDTHFVMEPLFKTRLPWKTVYKCGRQVSKCLHVDTVLERSNGELVRAGDVTVGDTLQSLDDKTLRAASGRVSRVWRSTRTELYRVTTRMGSTFVISAEHGLRTLYGYTPLKELKVGSRVATLRQSVTRSVDIGGATWDEITAISPVGAGEVVDFEIEKYHNFAVDGVITHNSTSLAAQGFIQAATTPYFNSLYVLPLFEMTRRFSSNVVRPFIEESSIKQLIVGSSCEQSVLQKTFMNKSIMFFTFAFLNCDRTRGISADKLSIDESITPCYITTYENFGEIKNKWLTDLQPSDIVVSFSEDGSLMLDEVVNVADHGKRECFRIETEEGHVIEATSESWIRTDCGWQRVSQIIEYAATLSERSCSARTRSSRVRSYDSDDAAGAATLRNASRGRALINCRKQSEVREQPRMGAADLQLGQVPDIVRVRSLDACEEEESRLRELVKLLRDDPAPGLRLLVSPLHESRKESGDRGLAESNRRGGPVGECGMVDRGRRISEPEVVPDDHTHRGVLQTRSLSSEGLAGLSPDRESGCQYLQELHDRQPVAPLESLCPCDKGAHREDLSLPAACDAVQSNDRRARGDGNLSLVRNRVYAGEHPGHQPACDSEKMLSIGGVCPEASQGTERTLPQPARGQGGEGCQGTSEVSCQPRGVSCCSQGEAGQACGRQPRGDQCPQACQECHEGRRAQESALDLPALRTDGTAGDSGSQDEVLPALQESGLGRNEKTLKAARIKSITCIGVQQVYDIETRNHHTFLANGVAVHNCQDMDWDFIPIIRETLSASKWGLEQYSGTPKTFDNTLEALWDDSSQAEWFIRCGCGHWNIPTTRYDALRMLGPVDNIAKYGTALICAKCGKPIDAAAGTWVHAYPDRFTQFTGYHVPQIILPMHYASDKKWTEFLRKRDRSAPNVFLNECMGESCDVGTKLVTQDELKNAACLHKLDFNACRNLDFKTKYIQRIMGVDWGGGGESEVSFTTIAIVGLCPDYRMELIWGERMHAAVNDVEEVQRIQEVFSLFQCHYFAHDFAGSGSVHETLLIQSGFPLSKVIPFSYVKTGGKALIRHHPPTASSSRHFYSLDKTWSLTLLCLLLKTKHLMLTEYSSSKDLIEDFLHIYEDKTETKHAGDILTIKRSPKLSDDFVHAVNYACCGHYHITQKPPKFAEQFGLTLTDEQRQVAQPPHHVHF